MYGWLHRPRHNSLVSNVCPLCKVTNIYNSPLKFVTLSQSPVWLDPGQRRLGKLRGILIWVVCQGLVVNLAANASFPSGLWESPFCNLLKDDVETGWTHTDCQVHYSLLAWEWIEAALRTKETSSNLLL